MEDVKNHFIANIENTGLRYLHGATFKALWAGTGFKSTHWIESKATITLRDNETSCGSVYMRVKDYIENGLDISEELSDDFKLSDCFVKEVDIPIEVMRLIKSKSCSGSVISLHDFCTDEIVAVVEASKFNPNTFLVDWLNNESLSTGRYPINGTDYKSFYTEEEALKYLEGEGDDR